MIILYSNNERELSYLKGIIEKYKYDIIIYFKLITFLTLSNYILI